MASRADEDIVLYAVGDVAPYRDDPSSIFRHVKHVLNQGDIVFCQLEANLSHRGTRLPQVRATLLYDPQIARAIKGAGFDVVSFASNHCMDWGREAFFDTIDALKEQELQVIGVGRNIEEARRPAILERKGTQVAFLAYNSILPLGYWAEVDRPGCTPLRAWTLYEPIEPAQPGRPCQIHTFPHRDDLEAMVDDIKKARSQADLVIVSMHCGIHFVPAVLAEYQKEIAHVAIDSGADLIIDTHAHILKGIEVYRGKVIFYSLCNFALELPARKEVLGSQSQRELQDIAIYGTHPEWLPYEKPDPEYPTYPFHPDARKTLIVKCIISNKAIKNVSFLPSYINKEAEPEVLSSRDTRFGEVVKYMEEITRSQELGTRYIIEGDEVVIHRESA